MLKKITSGLFVLAIAAMLAVPMMASAVIDEGAGSGVGLDLGLTEVGTQIGLGSEDIRTTIGSIINAALGFLGVVAVVIVLIGGFKYMTAGGSDEKVGEARKWIISGIIGLAIILSAFAITSFVIERLISATT